MSFLSINMQGAGCKDKQGWIRTLFHKHKVNFQQFKIQRLQLFSTYIDVFWGNNSFANAISPSCDVSEAILVIQDLDHITFKKIHSSNPFVAIEAVLISLGLNVLFIIVYVPQGADCQRHLWCNISYLISSFREECVFIGDFKLCVLSQRGWGLNLIICQLSVLMILLSRMI